MKKLIIGKDTEWGYTDLDTDFNNIDEGCKETGEHIFIADPYKSGKWDDGDIYVAEKVKNFDDYKVGESVKFYTDAEMGGNGEIIGYNKITKDLYIGVI